MKLHTYYDGKSLCYITTDDYGNVLFDYEREIIETGNYGFNNQYLTYDGETICSQEDWDEYKRRREMLARRDDHKNGGR